MKNQKINLNREVLGTVFVGIGYGLLISYYGWIPCLVTACFMTGMAFWNYRRQF